MKTERKGASKMAILIHLVFWALFITMNHFINMVSSYPTRIYLIDSIAKYGVAAFLFYTTALIIFPHFFRKGRYWLLAISIISMSFLSYAIKEFLYTKVLIHFDYPPLAYTRTEFFFINIWWWFQYTLMGVGYWYAKDSIEKQKMLRQAQLLQQQSEQEKLILENARLRAQINPHFLFNTLGYFHNRILDLDPELAEGVVALSDIMRSAIREPDQQGMVLLEEEVGSIENLVGIYQMRYSNGVYINLDIQVQHAGLKILPHILITLVENAMKHGALHDPQHPLTITMWSGADDLCFKVHNKKQTGPKERSHGIGIRYIRSQLDYTYKDHYSLEIIDEKDDYTVTLIIGSLSMQAINPSLIKIHEQTQMLYHR